MPEIKKILCAVDFSDASKRAYGCALGLAERLQAQLVVAHVYQFPAYAMPETMLEAAAELETGLQERLQRQLEDFVRSLDTRGVAVATRLGEGVPYVEVTRMAADLGADLIVVGTHGRTGLAHLLLGSVAERVVRSAQVPVLVVR